jgi:hypothetical protein
VQKKIAVLVRDRQEEALRVAVGIILLDDMVDVYVLDRDVAPTEQNALNLQTMEDFDMRVFTNHQGNKNMEYLSTGATAGRLLEYDHVLPY